MKTSLHKPQNKTLYLLYNILYTAGFMFCSGTVIQTFMLSVGMNDADVSAYNAVIQFVQAAVILIMSFFADRIKRVLKVYASIILSVSIVAAALVFCVFVRSDLIAVKVIVFASSVVAYFLIGVRNAVDYRIFYEIFDMRDLGRLMGVAIAISGLFSFGISALYSYAVTKFDYYDVMTAFFIFSAVSLVLSSFACFSYKKANDTPQSEKGRGVDLSAFKNKITRALALPGLFRGFSSGIMGLITVVGFSGGILDVKTASYLGIVTQITSFAGNLLFSALSKKVKSRAAVLISSVVFGAAMPLTVAGGNIDSFFIGYAVSNFAYVIVNISIPILVCEIVDYDQIGSFTCIRMMIFTLGSVIASVVYKPLSDLIGPLWLFLIAGIMQIFCGAAHYIVAKNAVKSRHAA